MAATISNLLYVLAMLLCAGAGWFLRAKLHPEPEGILLPPDRSYFITDPETLVTTYIHHNGDRQ